MKILRFTDDTPNIRKLIGERKILIALVRSLWLHAGFFSENLIRDSYTEFFKPQDRKDILSHLQHLSWSEKPLEITGRPFVK